MSSTPAKSANLLRAFYESIAGRIAEQTHEKLEPGITVLDPTCGSGAFLFAALNILQPLYEACLDRMQSMVEDVDRLNSLDEQRGRKTTLTQRPQLKDFRAILSQLDQHPNRDYFILKSIIVNNLYGVDIMEEATEICKLRLFLKLAAQVERDPAKDNMGLEPLPDIDFNIRAGNTLVGFATLAEVKQAVNKDMRSLLTSEETMQRIEQKARDVERDFENFRKLQTQLKVDPEVMTTIKKQVRATLQALDAELDRYLASEYGIDASNITDPQAYQRQFAHWQHTHQPFHWFVEFYGIINKGGFDVIIGNPPYVEWSKITSYSLLPNLYNTRNCGNLYTVVCERAYKLLFKHGQVGMIVPISCIATDRMEPLRTIWESENFFTYISHYSGDAHPSVLFQGVKFRLSILLQHSETVTARIYSTHFQRWLPNGRENLFPALTYFNVQTNFIRMGLIPKLSSNEHVSILNKLSNNQSVIRLSINSASTYHIYCHRIVAHFVKAFDFIPFFHNQRDGEKKSEDYKVFTTDTSIKQNVLVSLLNSSLFYLWFVSYSDVYHCGREIILDFPCEIDNLARILGDQLYCLKDKLMEDLQKNRIRRNIPYKATGMVTYDEFYPR